MVNEEVEKIKAISKEISPEETKERKTLPPDRDYFEALMRQGNAENKLAVEKTLEANDVKKPSLMDEVRNNSHAVERVSKTTPTELIAQSEQTIQRIDQIKETLATTNVELKSSVQNLMNNKLTHIDENIKIALSKAGAEFTSDLATPAQGLINPIEKYLGYLTHSQDQLKGLSSTLQSMHDNRQDLSPASMLAIQIKVGYIQQELEFFTSLLNKALESTKTLMNVQV